MTTEKSNVASLQQDLETKSKDFLSLEKYLNDVIRDRVEDINQESKNLQKELESEQTFKVEITAQLNFMIGAVESEIELEAINEKNILIKGILFRLPFKGPSKIDLNDIKHRLQKIYLNRTNID